VKEKTTCRLHPARRNTGASAPVRREPLPATRMTFRLGAPCWKTPSVTREMLSAPTKLHGSQIRTPHATKAPSRLQGRDTRNAWIDARCLWSGTVAAHCQANVKGRGRGRCNAHHDARPSMVSRVIAQRGGYTPVRGTVSVRRRGSAMPRWFSAARRKQETLRCLNWTPMLAIRVVPKVPEPLCDRRQ
jgi:hypothetical protein